MATKKRSVKRSSTKAASKTSVASRKWSADVMKHSDALDLDKGVFTYDNPHRIALSLKKSAESSGRRKAGPFQSAMSMLNFEINRAGKNLSAERKKILNEAKIELRKVFHRPTP